jgi:hypothetical protein
MTFFDRKNANVDVWLPIIGGPILSFVAFVAMWRLDPMSLSQMSGIPAFFLSMIVLMISQWFVTVRQMQMTPKIQTNCMMQLKTNIKDQCVNAEKGKQPKYKYRVISHNEPQINFFILLEYFEGSKEVLFNDFRGMGQDPIVLISRDNHIVEMFAIQFNLLWRRASEDHDSQATRSTSEK